MIAIWQHRRPSSQGSFRFGSSARPVYSEYSTPASNANLRCTSATSWSASQTTLYLTALWLSWSSQSYWKAIPCLYRDAWLSLSPATSSAPWTPPRSPCSHWSAARPDRTTWGDFCSAWGAGTRPRCRSSPSFAPPSWWCGDTCGRTKRCDASSRCSSCGPLSSCSPASLARCAAAPSAPTPFSPCRTICNASWSWTSRYSECTPLPYRPDQISTASRSLWFEIFILPFCSLFWFGSPINSAPTCSTSICCRKSSRPWSWKRRSSCFSLGC